MATYATCSQPQAGLQHLRALKLSQPGPMYYSGLQQLVTTRLDNIAHVRWRPLTRISLPHCAAERVVVNDLQRLKGKVSRPTGWKGLDDKKARQRFTGRSHQRQLDYTIGIPVAISLFQRVHPGSWPWRWMSRMNNTAGV